MSLTRVAFDASVFVFSYSEKTNKIVITDHYTSNGFPIKVELTKFIK